MFFTSKIEQPGHVIQGGENQEITGTEQRTAIHFLVTLCFYDRITQNSLSNVADPNPYVSELLRYRYVDLEPGKPNDPQKETWILWIKELDDQRKSFIHVIKELTFHTVPGTYRYCIWQSLKPKIILTFFPIQNLPFLISTVKAWSGPEPDSANSLDPQHQ